MADQVSVRTSDDEVIIANKTILKCSRFLTSMIDLSPALENEPIVLERISGPIFKKILEWCEKHQDDPIPETEDDPLGLTPETKLSEWDKKFLDLDQTLLFEVIMAANFLDIPSLLDASCQIVANMIMGKSPEQIREIFNIKNDMTPEEEELIRQENSWIENAFTSQDTSAPTDLH